MWPFMIELLARDIELGLLQQDSEAGRSRGFLFQGHCTPLLARADTL